MFRINKKITYTLTEDRIIPSLHSISRDGVLRELAEIAEKNRPEFSKDNIYQKLHEREKLGSTGIGNGVAIPHCHLSSLNEVEFFLARSTEGLSFGAYDGKPTYIFFMILAPETYSRGYLKSLGQLSRFLKDPAIKKRLLKSRGAEDIIKVINEAEEY